MENGKFQQVLCGDMALTCEFTSYALYFREIGHLGQSGSSINVSALRAVILLRPGRGLLMTFYIRLLFPSP